MLHSQYTKFSSSQSDIVLKLELENEPRDIHVLIRPGAKEFIRKMNKFYEIVIFTASVSKYATPLINLIDEKKLCLHRLYREHCSLVNTSFIKDLKKLGRDLKDIIIIDNTPLAYSLNKENGIPIVSWFEDKRDRELYNLIPILEFLSTVPDVRDFIPKLVINNEISYFASMDIIRKYKNDSKRMIKYKTSTSGNLKSLDIMKGEKVNNIIDQNKEKNNENKNNNNIEKNKMVETDKVIIEREEKIDIEKESNNDQNINLDINLADLLVNNDDDGVIGNKNRLEIKGDISSKNNNKNDIILNKDSDNEKKKVKK